MKLLLKDGQGACYFVGDAESDILDDTHGGMKFGWDQFVERSRHWEPQVSNQVTREEAQAACPAWFSIGVAAVQEGTKSYYLGKVNSSV